MTTHARSQIHQSYRVDNKSREATHNCYCSQKWEKKKPCAVLMVTEDTSMEPLRDAMTSKELCTMEKIKLNYGGSRITLPDIKLCFDIDCKNPEETSPVDDAAMDIIASILIREVKQVYGLEIEDDDIVFLQPFKDGPKGAHVIVPSVVLPRDLPLRESIYKHFVQALRTGFFAEKEAPLDVDVSILNGGFRLPFSEKESTLDAYYPMDWPAPNGCPEDPSKRLGEIEDFYREYCIHTYELEPTTPVMEFKPVEKPKNVAVNAAALDDDLDKMLEAICDKTFDNREDCVKLIWALKAMSPTEETFATIDKNMRRSKKYLDDTQWPRKIWNDYEDGKVSGKSFYFLLKRDNPDFFKTITKKGKGSKWSPIHSAVFNGTDKEYAELFQFLTTERFVFTTEPIESFWFTKNGRWFQDDIRGSKIRVAMSNVIPQAIRKFQENELARIQPLIDLARKALEMDPEDAMAAERLRAHSDEYASMKKKCKWAINKMRNDAPLKKALNMLKDDIADNTFIERLDANPSLLGFDNGVFDLHANEFRDHCDEDYVSFSTGFDYTDKPTAVDAVRSLLDTFFMESQDTDYVLHLLADTLDGTNRHEEFHIMTGKGGNGKGLLFSFMEQALGTDYFRWLDSSYLTTQRKSSSGPQPEMADKHGCRLLVASEPEEDQSLQVGKLKQITGGDKVTARPMYAKHERSFTPQFSLIFQTNDIPKLSAYDQGVERRIRIVNFPFSFKECPRGQWQRPIDRTLKSRIRQLEWRQSLIYILLQTRADGKGRLPLTPNIRESTQEYLRDNNPTLDLLRHYIFTGKVDDTVLTAEMLRHFREINPEISVNCRSIVYQLESNDVPTKRTKKGKAAYGIKRIPEGVMNELLSAEPSDELHQLNEFDHEGLNSLEFTLAIRKIYPTIKLDQAASRGIPLMPQHRDIENPINLD